MTEGHHPTEGPSTEASNECFVAVHIGAGRHSRKTEQQYKTVMKAACQKAEAVFRKGNTPLDAVVAAVAVLEDSEICNAGSGSNWTFGGHVECDASVMSGDGAFGAVGAVSGIQNPVTAAARLACQSRLPMLLQRVRPMFLAGDSAREWAHQEGLDAAENSTDALEWHKTEAAQARWERYHQMLTDMAPQKAESSHAASHHDSRAKKRIALSRSLSTEPASDGDDCLLLDTVGAVCVDSSGHLASGVSSGGIALKVDGRVGEAAMYGCGCYAQDPSDSRSGVACSVTGVGESIMRAGLAKAVCTQMLNTPAKAVDDTCEASIRDNILEGQPAAIPCPHKDCGILAVRVNAAGDELSQGQQSASQQTADGSGDDKQRPQRIDVEIGVACNSSSMGFAFLHGSMKAPECIMLRQGLHAPGAHSSHETFCCFGSNHKWEVLM